MLDQEKNQDEFHLAVIAHDIRSLHNVGSIFRSCDAFGVHKLYLTGISGTPPRREIAKVALGSEHRVPWEYCADVQSLLKQLTQDGYQIVALEIGKGSVPIHEMTRKNSVALLIGNEVTGLPKELLALAHNQVEIPMLGNKKSLNVSVALGIALFALTTHKR